MPPPLRGTVVRAALVCTAIRRLLGTDPTCLVVAEASDLDMAVRKVLGYKPDAALIDESVGGCELYDSLPRFGAASPRTAVVLLTEHDEPEYVRLFMRAGVGGLVVKQGRSSELVNAVHAVAKGQRYVSPQVGARVAIERELPSPRGSELTEREIEIMKFVALGYTNPQIADELRLSIRTVEAHRTHLRHKTHTNSRAEVSAYARACHVV